MKFTKSNVTEALHEQEGFLNRAAQALGGTRQGLAKFIKKHPDLIEIVDAYRSIRVEDAEQVVYGAAREGNLSAAMFVLKTQGRDRGWVEAKPLDARKDEISEEARAILTDLLDDRCTAAKAAIRFDTLGLPIPDSVRLLLGKETIEAPDPTDGQYAVITAEEMAERAKARLAEINGQQTDFLPERRREVAELKEELSGSNAFEEGKHNG